MIPETGVGKPHNVPPAKQRKPGPVERWVDANYRFVPFDCESESPSGLHKLAGVMVDCGLKVRWKNGRRGAMVRLLTEYRKSMKAAT